MLSLPHLVVLFLIALVVFGPQKLPELARMLGKATAEFRKMTNDFRFALEDEVRELDRQNRIREQEAAAAAARAAQAPEPPPAPAPEGSVPRTIPETTVTAAVEPPPPPATDPKLNEPENGASAPPHENSGASPTDTESLSVQHEKSANEHAA